MAVLSEFTSCYGRLRQPPEPGRRQRMKRRLLLVVVLGVCAVALAPGATQRAFARKKHAVVRQRPAGDYERCEEDCPPPGITARVCQKAGEVEGKKVG